jgi:hypothetical protein
MRPVSRIAHELRHLDVNQKGSQLMAGELTTIIWVLTDGRDLATAETKERTLHAHLKLIIKLLR